MRETRLYGSEGGGAARSPYPYPVATRISRAKPLASLVSVAKRLKVALGGWGEPRQVAIIRVGVWKNLEQRETSRQTALPADTWAQ